jgi:hypothetical protein
MTRKPGAQGLEGGACCVNLVCRHFQHGMGVLAGHCHRCADGLAKLCAEPLEVGIRIG